MFRAMALKELRELRGIAIGAMVIYCYITSIVIDPSSSLNLFSSLSYSWLQGCTVPFVGDSLFGELLGFCAVLMVVLLALWQTFGESVRGTYPYLLHRSASFGWLVGVKLVVGLGVYLFVTAIPIGIYAFWAATPGNFAGPFDWSMTVPAWVCWFAMTILYLGTFLTGIMPGRWYGSRFLPLAAAAFVLFVVVQLNNEFAEAMWLCVVILIVDIWIIILILFVAKLRDYS